MVALSTVRSRPFSQVKTVLCSAPWYSKTRLMSLRYDIEKIITTKKNIRTRPSARLNAIHECGLISHTYALIISSHPADGEMTGASAQPREMNAKFVRMSGATMNSSTLKSNAKMIEPAAPADVPELFLAVAFFGITTLTGALVKFSSAVPSASAASDEIAAS